MIRALLFAFALTAPAAAFAQAVADCRIQPAELNTKATLILKDFAAANGSLPDRMIVGSNIQITSAEENRPAGVRAVHEAFYRPLKDSTYAILPLPILGIEVTRDRHVLYVCARADTSSGTHDLTIYAMRGYHLDPSRLGTIFGDIFNAAEVKVTPVSVSAINLSQLNNGFLGIFRRIPLIGELIGLPQIPIQVIQQIAGRLTAEFAGLGVERIVLTEKYIELAVGIDLNDPSRARVTRRIDLKSASQLGPQSNETFSETVPAGDAVIYYDPRAQESVD